MKHLYEIDQRARNRRGEYTVIALDGSQMTIRYDDGTESVVGQAMQARIQDNMRIDEQVAVEEAERAATKRASGGSSSGGRSTWGRAWCGFEDSDLQAGTTGTHWRSRDSLGGAVALALSSILGRRMESTAPWRIAETHIYEPACFDKEHRVAKSKFLVKAREDGVWFGCYVERSMEPMDETWDWTRLVAGLRGNASLQDNLWQAMDTHDLELCVMEDRDELTMAIATAAPDGAVTVQHYDDEEPAGDAETVSWADLAKFLEKGRPGEWMNLFLVKKLDCAAALGRGQLLAQDAARVMAELWPFYEACAKSK